VRTRHTKLVTGWHFLDGPRLSQRLHLIPADEVEAAHRRLADEVFRPADPASDVGWWPYLVGPGADLIGRPAGVLRIIPDPAGSTTLTQPAPGKLERVDVDTGPIPGFVLGSVDGVTGPTDARIAVVLNGRIGGVSEVYSYRGEHGRFAVLVPESLFRAGRNRLELYLMEGSVLRPLAFR
jgi:hypothetical protein